jgi:hypothetical protein
MLHLHIEILFASAEQASSLHVVLESSNDQDHAGGSVE